MSKRVFLLVMDSFGIGGAADAKAFGDKGSNTLASVAGTEGFSAPALASLGLFHIDGVGLLPDSGVSSGAYARVREMSKGKDTTIGHWEIAGIRSEIPLPTYPNGFPQALIREFEKRCGRGILCNRPYSGTEVIRDYGREHMETGKLIVYTSADSVFQIAAHERVVPVEELYRYCRIARELLVGENLVGRVIARPFAGEWPYERTSRRHDFSAPPPGKTVLDLLSEAGYATIGVGKIGDIFAGVGVSESIRTSGNDEGMRVCEDLLSRDFEGLSFVNLVDFDMLYGHRRDARGYAAAVMRFDAWLPAFLSGMRRDDLLMITADHGCDPNFSGTDHTREDVPLLVYGRKIRPVNLGTLSTYSDIAATIADYFGVPYSLNGSSFLGRIA